MSESIEELRKRYHAAAHAMQSGVAMKMNWGDTEVTPKHLRVGINAAMADHSGLVVLLLAKGVITEEEYYLAIAESMEREKQLYEDELNEHYNRVGGSEGRIHLA